jgi:hypothetical protein
MSITQLLVVPFSSLMVFASMVVWVFMALPVVVL